MSRLTWATLVMVNEMSLRGWGLIEERLARLFLLSVRLVRICSLVREASYGVNCTATTEGMRIDWVYLREDEDECNTTSQLAQASMDSPWQACRKVGARDVSPEGSTPSTLAGSVDCTMSQSQ